MPAQRLVGFALVAVGSLALLLRASPPVSAGWSLGDARQLDLREESFDGESFDRVRLVAEAGSLLVVGEAGAEKARLRAGLFGTSEEALKDLELEHRIDGRTLVVEARTSKARNGRIDLELQLPAEVDLVVVDGSGSARIEGIAGSVRVEDGSGSLELSAVGGDVDVTDGSGSLSVASVGGFVRIVDGSGSIEISDAGRDVEITDGSGSIDVRGVGGDVRVTDGSGSIDVHDVGGRFQLLADGSGSVTTSGVRL